MDERGVGERGVGEEHPAVGGGGGGGGGGLDETIEGRTDVTLVTQASLGLGLGLGTR